MTIALATLCWADATLLDRGEDGTLDAVLEPALRRLIGALGSAETLRSAAIELVDERLAGSGGDPVYLDSFKVERCGICRRVIARPRVGARPGR